MALVLESSTMTMEALFRPSTRFQDSHRNRRVSLPEDWTELELLPELTLENVRATGVMWKGFGSNKILWITPDVFICSNFYGRGYPWVLVLDAVGGTSMRVHVRSGTAVAAATSDCMLVRLLATCDQHAIYINERYSTVSTRLSGAALSLFFQESRDSLRKVTLSTRSLNEDLCHALATMRITQLNPLWSASTATEAQ
jgi:hypothetical protein